MLKSPNRLVQTLIGKSIAETLLVGALAIFAYLTVLPPYFHGWSEVRDSVVAGWAVNNGDPWGRVEVHLYIDDQFVGKQLANISRPDVKAAGWANDEWHGYVFTLPQLAKGFHTAGVYARHDSGGGSTKSLQLLGDAIYFAVDESGKPVTIVSLRQK